MKQFDSEDTHMLLNLNARILLSERDYARLVSTLDNPKPPTPELQAAIAEYQRLKAAYPEANL